MLRPCLAFECYLEDCLVSLDRKQRMHNFCAEVKYIEPENQFTYTTVLLTNDGTLQYFVYMHPLL